jgi:hypothetical protein
VLDRCGTDAAANAFGGNKALPEAAMRPSSFASVLGAMLFFQAGCALSAPAASTNSSADNCRLIEGRALYEAQVDFGGARERFGSGI